MGSRRFTYILNHYSEQEASHFYHVLGLLEALGRRGTLITLVIEKADCIPRFKSANITVIVLKHRGMLRFVELFSVVKGLIRMGHTRTFVRIAAMATIIASLAHRLFGGQVFLWQSGTTLEYDLGQPLTARKVRWFFTSYLPNGAARRLAHVFVTGPASMVDYYSRVAGVPREKIRLLANDVDVTRFARPSDSRSRKAQFLSRHGMASNVLVLLLVHRLSPVRRTLDYFPGCIGHLRTVGLLGKSVVIVAGSGPELPCVQAETKRCNLERRCIFLGSVPNHEIHSLYAIADIFLHPTYNEGFSRVVLEAMAAGLPIISTDAGGTRELVGVEQNRFVVPRDNPAAFASGLEALVRDRHLRERLSRENVERVRLYSTDKVAELYESVLFA